MKEIERSCPLYNDCCDGKVIVCECSQVEQTETMLHESLDEADRQDSLIDELERDMERYLWFPEHDRIKGV